jgi:hypothetical protein
MGQKLDAQPGAQRERARSCGLSYGSTGKNVLTCLGSADLLRSRGCRSGHVFSESDIGTEQQSGRVTRSMAYVVTTRPCSKPPRDSDCAERAVMKNERHSRVRREVAQDAATARIPMLAPRQELFKALGEADRSRWETEWR